MRTLLSGLLWVVLVVALPSAARAQHDEAASPDPAAHETTAPHAAAEHDAAHDVGPVAPETAHLWPGLTVMAILTMFVFAAAVGIISRLHAPPEELPPTHSHDEPPGASHHHGSSGTINPEPGHGHHH